MSRDNLTPWAEEGIDWVRARAEEYEARKAQEAIVHALAECLEALPPCSGCGYHLCSCLSPMTPDPSEFFVDGASRGVKVPVVQPEPIKIDITIKPDEPIKTLTICGVDPGAGEWFSAAATYALQPHSGSARHIKELAIHHAPSCRSADELIERCRDSFAAGAYDQGAKLVRWVWQEMCPEEYEAT